mgnify:CR=1 FL=1
MKAAAAELFFQPPQQLTTSIQTDAAQVEAAQYKFSQIYVHILVYNEWGVDGNFFSFHVKVLTQISE